MRLIDIEDKSVFDKPLVPILYYDRMFKREAAKLLPGEYYVTRRNVVLVTVLGSCIAACIRDKTNGIGGMNHFMLPVNANEQSGWGASSTRYGIYAMEILINEILKLGAQRKNLEAKLFGGGAVIESMNKTHVGELNAEFAIEYLKTEGIALVGGDMLDHYSRKVYYFPHSGKALIKKLHGLQNNTIKARETEYKSSLVNSRIEGSIELFT